MRETLRIARIDTKYINYLKQFQEHIWNNDDKGNIRPYVGIVLELDGVKYYAPMTSPKAKNMYWVETLTFIRIEDQGVLKCAVYLNNLIPVDDYVLVEFDINSEEPGYATLLNLQQQELRKRADHICRNAAIIYNKVTKYGHEPQNAKLVKDCYDFKLLEQKLVEYKDLNKAEEAPGSQEEKAVELPPEAEAKCTI